MKTNFFEKVYEVVKKIPEGKVTSYGAIASFLGSPRSARMVGWVLNKSNTMTIPVHRVVNKQGLLTGNFHFVGRSLMQQLLENEGVEVENNQIKQFKKHFWDPICHLPPTNIENK
tara:strand:- start:283 stop:627 length:345 start_codon:yes stop_codon:yes gene_type:complete